MKFYRHRDGLAVHAIVLIGVKYTLGRCYLRHEYIMCSLIINAHTFIIMYADGGNDRLRPSDFRNERHKEIFCWSMQIIIVDANIYELRHV